MHACTGSGQKDPGTARTSHARARWKAPFHEGACLSTKGTTAVTAEGSGATHKRRIGRLRNRTAAGLRCHPRGMLILHVIRADLNDVFDKTQLESVHDGKHHSKSHHTHRDPGQRKG